MERIISVVVVYFTDYNEITKFYEIKTYTYYMNYGKIYS